MIWVVIVEGDAVTAATVDPAVVTPEAVVNRIRGLFVSLEI
jgi:hypothetical protein